MDKHWDRMRVETPHVKRPPSEYVREHVWFTTQPIEEPDNPQHLTEVIEWLAGDGRRRSNARRRMPYAILSVSPPSRSRSRTIRSIWPRSSNGSAGTG